jgi:hypothetical protein
MRELELASRLQHFVSIFPDDRFSSHDQLLAVGSTKGPFRDGNEDRVAAGARAIRTDEPASGTACARS